MRFERLNFKNKTSEFWSYHFMAKIVFRFIFFIFIFGLSALICISSCKKETPKPSNQAIGKTADSNSVESLIAALKDDNKYVRSNAAEALGKIGDIRAVEPIISALKDNDDFVRRSSVVALVKIGDQRAVPALVTSLKDWDFGKKVAIALQKKFGWQPQNVGDKVHYAIAMRDKSVLIGIWEQMKGVLLEDVLSNEYIVIENALYAFIALGREEIIPDLIKTLNSKGNKTMAEAYLNCGQKELDSAARAWSASHGYYITVGTGTAPVGWGEWR